MSILENLNGRLKEISQKILSGTRIDKTDGIFLFHEAELGILGYLANFIREKKNKHYTFFNKNYHIEPTNICINHCKFCSYRKDPNQNGCWEYNLEEIKEIVKKHSNKSFTEVHIVGGVHPDKNIHYYSKMLKLIKDISPNIHIKAFSAVEIDHMINKSKLNLDEGIKMLIDNGLNSIPGGGAEIFNVQIRNKICPDKTGTKKWLEIHEAIHNAGLPSNATILYGHIENYSHRIDHLELLRNLQDKTKGFNAFIPLKFRNENNLLSDINETTTIEDLRNYAISRIYLDNFPHIKAYWPMIGKETTQLALSFGVDDIDGTIEDSTKIYAMAGAEDSNPAMTTEELIQLIKNANRIPVERDSLYNEIRKY